MSEKQTAAEKAAREIDNHEHGYGGGCDIGVATYMIQAAIEESTVEQRERIGKLEMALREVVKAFQYFIADDSGITGLSNAIDEALAALPAVEEGGDAK